MKGSAGRGPARSTDGDVRRYFGRPFARAERAGNAGSSISDDLRPVRPSVLQIDESRRRRMVCGWKGNVEGILDRGFTGIDRTRRVRLILLRKDAESHAMMMEAHRSNIIQFYHIVIAAEL